MNNSNADCYSLQSSSSSSDSDSDSDISSDDTSSDGSSASSSSSSSSSESESDSDDWESSESSSSSSDSDDDAVGGLTQLKGRARWLKKTADVKEKVVKDKDGRAKARAEARAVAAAAREAAVSKEEVEAAKSGGLANQKITASLLDRKVKEIVAQRGRRGTDTKDVLRKLENLSTLSVQFGPRVEVPILMHVIAAQFDLIRTLDDFMDTSTWKACAVYLNRILVLLEDGKEKLTLTTVAPDEDELMVGNLLSIGSNASRMKAAAQTGELGARDAISADVRFVNPHTVRRYVE
jgi:hypothetical protein